MRKLFCKHSCVLFLLSFLINYANAQVNFKEGIVVLRNGDTVKGQIDYRNWEINPTKLRFKQGASVSLYTAHDLLSFEIVGEDKYQSAIITKDMRPVDIAGLNKVNDEDSLVTDTAFLRVLLRGTRVTLFELIDHKIHFYIQEDIRKQPEELIYKKYLDEANVNLYERPYFRNQLNRLANNYKVNGLDKKIDRCNYSQEDLQIIIRVINGEDLKTVKAIEKKKKQPIQLMIGGGAQYYSFSIVGDYEKYTAFQFENKIGPVASIALDAFAGRNAQKLAVRFELSYTQMKYDGAYEANTILLNRKVQYSYQITQNNITPQIAILYHFVNKKNFRMYGGGSFALTFSSYPTNVYNEYTVETGQNQTTHNDLDLEKMWVHSDVILGARLYNKVNLGLSTKLFGGFINYNNISAQLFPLAFTASYIFVNRKNSFNR